MDSRLGAELAAHNLALGQHDTGPSILTVHSCGPACCGCHTAHSAASTSLLSCAAAVECSKSACAKQLVSACAVAQCEKCQNNRAFFKEIQMRSADEPATVFYQCTKCPNRWKED